MVTASYLNNNKSSLIAQTFDANSITLFMNNIYYCHSNKNAHQIMYYGLHA